MNKNAQDALKSYILACKAEEALITELGGLYFLWKFWNTNNLSKYKPRLIIRNSLYAKYRGIFRCDNCGVYMTTYHISGDKKYCKSCEGELREELLLTERQKIRQRGEELIKKFDDGLCKFGDLCPTLKAHKELLQDDDNRLSSEFILERINLAYENIHKKLESGGIDDRKDGINL